MRVLSNESGGDHADPLASHAIRIGIATALLEPPSTNFTRSNTAWARFFTTTLIVMFELAEQSLHALRPRALEIVC